MAIELATFEQIATILSQLSTNYSNLFVDYYNIFYNPTPMDVTLQYYDEVGKLYTITIPNRAKDKTFILNGNGEPEGTVSGHAGAIYQDLTNGNVYVKELSATDVSGWNKVLSLGELENYISKGTGSPEGVVLQPKGALYVDMNTSSLYIKNSSSGNTGWTLASANIAVLASIDLDNITEAGENVVMNLADIAIDNSSTVASLQTKSNLVQTIDSSSTDDTYPSTLATYNKIMSEADGKANKDLDNLSSTGEKKLIERYSDSVFSNSVIPATIGGVSKNIFNLPSISSNTVTVPAGSVYRCAGGVNNDGTFIFTDYSFSSSMTVTIPSTPSKRGYIFFSLVTNSPTLECFEEDNYLIQDEEPATTTGKLLYMPKANLYLHYYQNSWQVASIGTVIARYTTNDLGQVDTFSPYSPMTLASNNSVFSALDGINYTKNVLGGQIDSINGLLNPILQNGSLAQNGLCIRTEVDTINNTWYRIFYSDNQWPDADPVPSEPAEIIWIEQGGVISTESDMLFDLAFPVPFTSTEYFIVKNFGSSSISSVGAAYLGFWNKTLTEATTRSMGNSYNQYWYACGR